MVTATILQRKIVLWGKSGLRFLFLTLLFALIYTQSPLYSSNQNHYFLHGLAQADVGFLREDWLVSSPDPMPVFSALVWLTISLTQQPAWFYLEYAIIMGIYFLSMLEIVKITFSTQTVGREWPRTKSLVFISAFLLIHSAAWRFTLGRSFGSNWIYLLEDGLADQRLLGTVFQPSVFGVFLVASIACFLKNRKILADISAALAAILHPTYLISTLILTVTYLLIDFSRITREKCRNKQKIKWQSLFSLFLPGLITLVITLPIFTYVLTNFASSPRHLSIEANRILIEYRIPHHTLAGEWFDSSAVAKIALFILALVIARKTHLFAILSLTGFATAVLTIIQIISGNQALALLFPWRSSTFLIPISSSIILAWIIIAIFRQIEKLQKNFQNRIENYSIFTSTILIIMLLAVGIVRLHLDFQRQQLATENSLYSQVKTHGASNQVYLIPIKLQDFRLKTGIPVYVDFKSHPYNSEDVIEWRRRIKLAENFYRHGNCTLMHRLISEGITHIVVPRQTKFEICSGLELLYQDESYLVFIP